MDSASTGLQESLQDRHQQLPEAARRLAAFLDDAVTQSFLDDAPVMGLVGRLVHRALQLPTLVQVPRPVAAARCLLLSAVARARCLPGAAHRSDLPATPSAQRRVPAQGMNEAKIHLAAKDFAADSGSLLDSLQTINRRGFARASKLAPLVARLELASALRLPHRAPL